MPPFVGAFLLRAAALFLPGDRPCHTTQRDVPFAARRYAGQTVWGTSWVRRIMNFRVSGILRASHKTSGSRGFTSTRRAFIRPVGVGSDGRSRPKPTTQTAAPRV